MQAGELRTPIRIQREISDGTGSFAAKKWVDICDESDPNYPYILAKWVNVHGSEAWVADSLQAQLGATITIRYRKDVKCAYIILLDETKFKIVSIDNIRQRNEWLEIKVKAAEMG